MAAAYTAQRIYKLVTGYFEVERRRKIYPYFEEAYDEALCKGPHKWDKTKLIMPPLPMETYMVCTECGYISGAGGGYKINAPALEVYRAHIVRRDERFKKNQDLIKQKQQAIDEAMNRLIKLHVVKFEGSINDNTEILQKFFRMATLEVESIYVTLGKQIDEDNG